VHAGYVSTTEAIELNLLTELPLHDSDGNVRVVVETPRGSTVKLKYDEHLGIFEWSRCLSHGVSYPYDYGFLPQTITGDRDAVDALVMVEAASVPGAVIACRIIGALRLEQRRDDQPPRRNDRIIAVPARAHRLASLTSVSQLAERVRGELAAFFEASLALTGKNVQLLGWSEPEETTEMVAAAHAAFNAGRAP
jgi:inorganic pyrophosphatase